MTNAPKLVRRALALVALPAALVLAAPAVAASPAEAPASSPGGAAEQPASPSAPPAEPAAPQVQAQLSQGSSPAGSSAPGRANAKGKGSPAGGSTATSEASSSSAARARQKAASPSALTPGLSPALESGIAGVPGFFIEDFQVPPFLLPIYQAAGSAYGIPWQVLAAINEVETDYGRDLSVSSAGAEGWMQFLPAEWAQYGIDANGDGYRDPYNPADAIFAAARYLRAAGGNTDIKSAVFSYNHSQAYVDSVMLRAQLLGGTPSELLGAITGLTEARFPVHAPSHFDDGFATVPAIGSRSAETLVGTTINGPAGAPVIAVQDGEIVQIGNSPSLGRFISLRDAFGNTYVYAQLGEVASVYPVLQPHVHTAPSGRIAQSGLEPAPSGPATAGAQPRSPISAGATASALALGAAADLESSPLPPPAPDSARAPVRSSRATKVRVLRDGANDVYLHTLLPGAQVIAGTVLGHLGAGAGAGGSQPHIFFQIRPAGVGAPLIDPKPILDGWVALENSSIFRAKGENPFLATSPTVGQVLLESKQQLEPQVLHDGGIRLGRCGRQDVQAGRVEERVLAMLEYLSVSGLRPTVSGLRCGGSTPAALAASIPTSAGADAIDISAVNGIPIAGHQGSGSIADTLVRKLLMLQGLARPHRIVSLMSFPGASVALASPGARDSIHVAFSTPSTGVGHAAGLLDSSLSPSDWIKLIARLGEIPDPTVGRGPSAAAIPDNPSVGSTTTEGGAGGNG